MVACNDKFHSQESGTETIVASSYAARVVGEYVLAKGMPTLATLYAWPTPDEPTLSGPFSMGGRIKLMVAASLRDDKRSIGRVISCGGSQP